MGSITEFLSQLLTSDSGLPSLGQAFLAIGVAYLGGLVSSLTPCIYPMIPITISVVGGLANTSTSAHLSKHQRWRALGTRMFAYIVGMACVYSFLGVLAGLTGRVFGTLTNTAGWYVGLGVVMTFSSLFMMDVIPFDPLAWWESFKRKIRPHAGRPHHTHSSTEHQEVTLLGALSLGASSGFIAAPCTTPVLTAILAYVAKTQSIGLGLALMFSFALGLGTLLMAVAVFAGMFQILPKSGNWMVRMKIFSGLLLLAFAQYLFYSAGMLGGIK